MLKAVLGVDDQPFGILRISSPSAKVSGRLAIEDGAYIVGAMATSDVNTDGVESGYGALRRLLAARDGNFAYLDVAGTHPRELDDTLHISIEKVCELLPDLPDDPSTLFDEKSLLDKIFGAAVAQAASVKPASAQPPSLPQPRRTYRVNENSTVTETLNSSPHLQEAVAPGQYHSLSGNNGNGNGNGNGAGERLPAPLVASAAANPAWQLFQPLISNAAVASPQYRNLTPTSGFAFDLEDTGEHRSSLVRLRSQARDDLPWYKELLRKSPLPGGSVIWILAAFGLLLVATLFGCIALNQHTSLTIQRSARTAQP